MQRETITDDVKTHDNNLRFVREDTPSKGYEALFDAFLREGVDAERVPDGARVGQATLTVEAADGDRLYIDGDVTVDNVEVDSALQ